MTDVLESICDRLIAMCKRADEAAGVEMHYRFGHLPNAHEAHAMPLVYATPSPRPEVNRAAYGARGGTRLLPQLIEYEVWLTVLDLGPTPEDVQRKLMAHADRYEREIEKDVTLSTPGAAGSALCATLRVIRQGRLERMAGRNVEGVVLRVRPVVARA